MYTDQRIIKNNDKTKVNPSSTNLPTNTDQLSTKNTDKTK